MKINTYLGFFLWCLIATGYVCAAEKAATRAGKEYAFTLKNEIKSHKSPIYGVVYEKVETSRWKRVQLPFSLEFNKPYTVSLSDSQKYAYALGASAIVLNKETISEQERAALEAKTVTPGIHKITSLDFSLKNPLEVGVISLTNDYVAPIFVARYVFDAKKIDVTKKLQVDLASAIARCESKQTIDIAVPIGYKGADVLLVASRTIDTLTASVDIEKAAVLISRSSFEDLKQGAPKKNYNASALFAENTLTVVNDTSRDWAVGIYGKKNAGLQLLTEAKYCSPSKKSLFNKNFFLPASQFDSSPLLWVLFDTDDKKIAPTTSLHYTMHGGTVARGTKTVYLSKWFVENKKDTPAVVKDVQMQEVDALQDSSGDAQKVVDAVTDKDSKASEKEGVLQESITGTFDCSLKNDTSKDIFVALYKQEKKQYLRREKPLKVAIESAVAIGFEETELLAFSVSHLELKESLSAFEWDSLNSIASAELKALKGREQQAMFTKKGSFDLAEIMLKNDSYSDCAVGRYEYKDEQGKRGQLTLCGVVQSIPKKSFDIDAAQESKDDAAAAVNGTPNFALPQGYKGFLGYNSVSDEKNFSSDLPERIDAIIDFQMTHLGRIDSTQATVFAIDKDLTGKGLMTVENDFEQGAKWVALYSMRGSAITNEASYIEAKKGKASIKEFIPYQEQMKIVVKENSFNVSRDLKAPYGEILVNTAERLSYKLTEAEMVTVDPDSAQNIKKAQAIAIAALLKQKQQQAAQAVDRKIEAAQKAKKQRKRFTEPKQEKIEAAIVVPSSKPWVPKPVSPVKAKAIRGECSATQVRIENNSGKAITVRFYYRGFVNKSMTAHGSFYGVSNGDALCLDMPESKYFDSRYIVVGERNADFKENYSSQEVAKLMKNTDLVKKNRAFNVEKERKVIINKVEEEKNIPIGEKKIAIKNRRVRPAVQG